MEAAQSVTTLIASDRINRITTPRDASIMQHPLPMRLDLVRENLVAKSGENELEKRTFCASTRTLPPEALEERGQRGGSDGANLLVGERGFSHARGLLLAPPRWKTAHYNKTRLNVDSRFKNTTDMVRLFCFTINEPMTFCASAEAYVQAFHEIL